MINCQMQGTVKCHWRVKNHCKLQWPQETNEGCIWISGDKRGDISGKSKEHRNSYRRQGAIKCPVQNTQADFLFVCLFPGDCGSYLCGIKFDSYFYVYMQNVVRMEKHSDMLSGRWGAGRDTQGLTNLVSQTALLTLGFCDNYKALPKRSFMATLLPKQPGGPGKLIVIGRRQMTVIP